MHPATNFCRKAKVVSLLCLIGITFKATMGCFLHSSTNWFPFSVYDPSIREQNLEQNELQRVSSNLNNTVMWLQKFRWKLFFWVVWHHAHRTVGLLVQHIELILWWFMNSKKKLIFSLHACLNGSSIFSLRN